MTPEDIEQLKRDLHGATAMCMEQMRRVDEWRDRALAAEAALAAREKETA